MYGNCLTRISLGKAPQNPKILSKTFHSMLSHFFQHHYTHQNKKNKPNQKTKKPKNKNNQRLETQQNYPTSHKYVQIIIYTPTPSQQFYLPSRKPIRSYTKAKKIQSFRAQQNTSRQIYIIFPTLEDVRLMKRNILRRHIDL